MKCLTPFRLNNPYYDGTKRISLTNPLYMDVPCGHCIECQKKHINEVALRLRHEAFYNQIQMQESGVFCTLTFSAMYEYPDGSVLDTRDFIDQYDSLVQRKAAYRNALALGLPDINCDKATHNKREFQLFMKKLRRSLEYDYSKGKLPRLYKLKYFAVAEYGSKAPTHRKHYHAVILGAPYSVLRSYIPKAWDKCDWQVQSEDSIQPIQEVSKAVAYMCKYMSKGLSTLWYDSPERADIVREYKYPRSYPSKYHDYIVRLNAGKMKFIQDNFLPFTLLSGGLGKRFALDNKFSILQNLAIQDGKFYKPVPRYYKNVLLRYFEENDIPVFRKNFYEKSMEKRKQFVFDIYRSDSFKSLMGEAAFITIDNLYFNGCLVQPDLDHINDLIGQYQDIINSQKEALLRSKDFRSIKPTSTLDIAM